jgi:hypothetical protein
MASGSVSVPSFQGQIAFTVTGTNTLLYAQTFANALNNALSGKTLGYRNLSTPTDNTVDGQTPSATPTVTEQEISISGATGSYTLLPDTPPGGVYTFVDASGPITVTGSGTGDDLLVAAINAATTYNDVGGNNLITFVDGNNTYLGDPSVGGTDTIVAGSGFDSIYTGGGQASVYSGTGDALIDLRDTAAAGATGDPTSVNPADYNQFVYLADGSNTVYMNGVADVVIASALPNSITGQGQLIFGGAGTDLVALVPPAGTASAAGDDTVVSGSGTTSVYDGSNNNIMWDGTGSLTVAFADSVEGSVVAGAGTTVVYGSAGDTIDYFSTATSGSAIFVAGSGANESVDASGSAGSLTMVLGTGNETLIGGSGPTNFNANFDTATGLTGSITINDFGGSDVFNFVGYSASQAGSIATNGTQTSSGYQITLSDGTKVTFAGLTTLNGHYTNS